MRSSDNLENLPLPETVAVIGGGIAGVTTAIALAKRKVKVTLFEKSIKLLNGTSDATPCRINVGFHYAMHMPTAKKCLYSAINLIRYFREGLNGDFQVMDGSNAQGVTHEKIYYVIADESRLDLATTLKRFEELKQCYAELVAQDPKNQVLGPVEQFYTVVEKEKFSDLLNISKVQAVILTCETLFAWDLFKPYLLYQIKCFKNIEVHKNTEVLSLRRTSDFQIELTYTSHGIEEKKTAKAVVNASCFNVDLLNAKFGIISKEEIYNRWKGMSIVQVPPTLRNYSFLIGFGPFCSLTTMKDKGFVTYEPVTNLRQFRSKENDPAEKIFKDDLLLPEEKMRLAHDIVNGAAEWIKPLTLAQVEELRIGAVRSEGGVVDINSDNGEQYTRCDNGVKKEDFFYVSSEARKHTFWPENEAQVISFLEQDTKLFSRIPQLSHSTFSLFSQKKMMHTQLLERTPRALAEVKR